MKGDFFMSKLMFEDRLKGRKDAVGNDFNQAFKVFIADRKRMGCTERTIEWYEEVEKLIPSISFVLIPDN
jgi:hypothetical protein